MSDFGTAIGDGIIVGIVVVVIIAFILGGLVVWLAPKVWYFIKPYIHYLTS